MKLKLPNDLICCAPSTIKDPIRIGCASDGGYIVPKMVLDHCDDLLSFGLGENWSFDREWKKLKPDSKIHMYDGTVSLSNMKDYLRDQYSKFFNSSIDVFHYQENVGKKEINPAQTEFATTLQRLGSEKIFLKMDIEGGEFQILEDILAHADFIPAMVVEIHFANYHRENFKYTVERIKEFYELVHTHGNNHTPLGTDGSCDCYEFTFIRKDLCNDTTKRYEFYIDGLDVSNVPGLDDYEFYFEQSKAE